MTEKHLTLKRSARVPALALALGLLLAGCATQQTTYVVGEPAGAQAEEAPPAAPAGTLLEYKMPAGRTLTYTTTDEMVQVMDVMGQAADMSMKGGGTFTFTARGSKDRDLLLGVTIDDMSTTMTSPMGDMSPDMGPVKGRSFDMVLSPLGIEVDASAAEAITYESANGTSNVAPSFKLFFPDLPDHAIEAGGTWTATASMDDTSGGMNIKLGFENANTFEGMETVDGMECARIKAAITSTITGTGSQQGMDMALSGTGKGSETWFFAVKEGIYVKSVSELTYDLTISVSAMGMTIPVTQTRKSETKLIANE